jgi:hypothetical protein
MTEIDIFSEANRGTVVRIVLRIANATNGQCLTED